MKRLLIALGLLTSSLSAAPAYFISIDGLQPDLLKVLKQDGRLREPRGFAWLLDHSLVVDKALPLMTSITAPSHVSTITCSPPSRHGIIANEYLKNGERTDGFAEPFASEPLWRAVMRQGKSVLALAYVGADGRTAERSATYGLAYPRPEKLGPAQTLQFKPVPAVVPVNLLLNPETKEQRALTLDIRSVGEILVKSGETTLGVLKPESPTLDVFSQETKGPLRRSIIRLLPGADAVRLAISKATYNEAYPESFRARLDALQLVWPDYSVKGLNLPLPEAVHAQGRIDRFLAEVGTRLAPELRVDLVLFYQPLLDTIGHELQGRLPRPFQSQAQDPVTQAFVAGFQEVDRNLSQLLAQAGAETPIALMGDHGMDAIERMVNTAALLRPSSQGRVRLLASGQLLLLYPAPGHTAAEAALVGEELQSELKKLNVLAQGSRRRDFATRASNYTREWQYGDAVWAFQGASRQWLTYDPKARSLFLPPRAGGMHGTVISDPAMATTLLIHGPTAPREHRATASLIQAVPTFVEQMGLRPPMNCLGRSLLPQNLSLRKNPTPPRQKSN